MQRLTRRFRAGFGRCWRVLSILLAVPVAWVFGQEVTDSRPATRPQHVAADAEAAGEVVQKMMAALAEGGIRLDLKKKSVSFDAVVHRPDDLLEYIIITRRGKSHEALLITEVRPSLLNTALLALGLKPGENARSEEIDPPPTREEVESGAPMFRVFPPKGPQLWLTASWFEGEGEDVRRVEVAIEDLVIDVETTTWVRDNRWVYLGGRMAAPYEGDPEAYMADLQGNLVSMPYMVPANHLIAMDHKRARDERNWWIAKKCPEPGKTLQVTIHTAKPKLCTEREARLRRELGPSEGELEAEKARARKPAESKDTGPVESGGGRLSGR